MKGQCNCGGVRYRISVQLAEIFCCHCSICRRGSGRNGIAVAICPQDSFEWVAGGDGLVTWQKPDSHWKTSFCPRCGSPMPIASDALHAMIVPAGSIMEGGESLRVAHHSWVGSSAPWDRIGDTGAIHQEAIQLTAE